MHKDRAISYYYVRCNGIAVQYLATFAGAVRAQGYRIHTYHDEDDEPFCSEFSVPRISSYSPRAAEQQIPLTR